MSPQFGRLGPIPVTKTYTLDFEVLTSRSHLECVFEYDLRRTRAALDVSLLPGRAGRDWNARVCSSPNPYRWASSFQKVSEAPHARTC
jgi:hypothetical protein